MSSSLEFATFFNPDTCVRKGFCPVLTSIGDHRSVPSHSLYYGLSFICSLLLYSHYPRTAWLWCRQSPSHNGFKQFIFLLGKTSRSSCSRSLRPRLRAGVERRAHVRGSLPEPSERLDLRCAIGRASKGDAENTGAGSIGRS